MPDRWFLVPDDGDGARKYVDPEGRHSGLVGCIGDQPAGIGKHVVRVYGTQSALDDLAARPGVVEAPDTARQALAQRAGSGVGDLDADFRVLDT